MAKSLTNRTVVSTLTGGLFMICRARQLPPLLRRPTVPEFVRAQFVSEAEGISSTDYSLEECQPVSLDNQVPSGKLKNPSPFAADCG